MSIDALAEIRNVESDLRVEASGSIGPMCFFWGTASPHPFIVRDESGRLFLGAALQQSPPLRRPSLILDQARNSVKTNPFGELSNGAVGADQNRLKWRRISPALTDFHGELFTTELPVPMSLSVRMKRGASARFLLLKSEASRGNSL